MKFEIKHRFNGKILFSVNAKNFRIALGVAIEQKADLRSADLRSADLRYADLHYADLRYADLHYADLHYADLRYADLRYADLRSADLRSADLRSADLRSADLRYADLRGTKGINKFMTTPMYILMEQIGKIRAYKLVNSQYKGPQFGGIKYIVGKIVKCKADTNESVQCSYGISLASLDWCISEWQLGYHILVCEFSNKDIAAIPIASDGKFRVHKCKIIKKLSLKGLGLEKQKC